MAIFSNRIRAISEKIHMGDVLEGTFYPRPTTHIISKRN